MMRSRSLLVAGLAAIATIGLTASPAMPDIVEPYAGPAPPDSRRRFNLRRGRPTSKYMPAAEDRKHGFLTRRARELNNTPARWRPAATMKEAA